VPLLINNEFVESKSDIWYDVHNPVSGCRARLSPSQQARSEPPGAVPEFALVTPCA